MRSPHLLCACLLLLTCWLHAAHAQPVPVKVDAKAKAVYHPGLPIVVDVTITNTSDKTIETMAPIKQMHSLGATVRREGETEILRPSRHSTYVVDAIRTVELKPKEKLTARVELNMIFQDALPVGRYLCTVTYLFGKEHVGVQNARSAPVVIEIQEPTDAVPEMQRDMRREAVKFQSAQIYHSDHTEHGSQIALQIFSELAEYATHPEYRKVSAYYRALLEKEPKTKLAAYLKYLKNPTTDLPDLTDMDDINRTLGHLYFETGDFRAAREAFLKVSHQDNFTRNILQKIEDTLKSTS